MKCNVSFAFSDAVSVYLMPKYQVILLRQSKINVHLPSATVTYSPMLFLDWDSIWGSLPRCKDKIDMVLEKLFSSFKKKYIYSWAFTETVPLGFLEWQKAYFASFACENMLFWEHGKPILFEVQLDKCFNFYEPHKKKFIPFLQIVKIFLFLETSPFTRNWYHSLNISYVDGELFIKIVKL